MSRRSMWPGILVSLLVPAVIFAGNAVLPFTFTSGSPIRASEMNANFESLRAAINLGNSGTRLKQLAWRFSDGARFNLTGLDAMFWDSQMKVQCRPTSVTVRSGRCLPNDQLEWFADPSCVQEAATPSGGIVAILNESQDAGLSYELARSMLDGGVYRLGPIQRGQLYQRTSYLLSDGGVTSSCGAKPGGASQSYQPATVPVPITDFVEFEWGVE